MINQQGNIVDDGGCMDIYRCRTCGYEISSYSSVCTCPNCGNSRMLVNLAAARSDDWSEVRVPTIGEVLGTKRRCY